MPPAIKVERPIAAIAAGENNSPLLASTDAPSPFFLETI